MIQQFVVGTIWIHGWITIKTKNKCTKGEDTSINSLWERCNNNNCLGLGSNTSKERFRSK